MFINIFSGCPCQYTQYGCCPDGETTALGAKNEGCDDCRYAKLVTYTIGYTVLSYLLDIDAVRTVRQKHLVQTMLDVQ
jgi:hypothetical protein